LLALSQKKFMRNILKIVNHQPVSFNEIPVLNYVDFYDTCNHLLDEDFRHCVAYYAFEDGNFLRFICAIADDHDSSIHLFSYKLERSQAARTALVSLAARHYPMHIYEREITENWGVRFEGHPWAKPVRYAHNRADKNQVPNNYPFFDIGGSQLHHVGVGPVHASIIEPGFFKFLCNGEMVQHLEIQLGWQHRGVEQLYLTKGKLLQRNILSENIAGDTAVGHATTFAMLMESLGGVSVASRLQYERGIALELERIAMHVADLSNLCVGIAYQLGASVFGALRTPVINYNQWWCGNRFGKGLIRTGGSHFTLHAKLADRLLLMLNDFSNRFQEMASQMFSMPGVLERLEEIGTVSTAQAKLIGAVGMAARSSGLLRDLRHSHPFGVYRERVYRPAMVPSGDVYARAFLRKMEIEKSILYIQSLLQQMDSQHDTPKPLSAVSLQPDAFSISMVEGWRGEIVHTAVTNSVGEIVHYKVKDPSFHNWLALGLALRQLEISDFPINNKSFNLSYCGHDL
jgi:Ni,Fe-hydrogenase III large subunit